MGDMQSGATTNAVHAVFRRISNVQTSNSSDLCRAGFAESIQIPKEETQMDLNEEPEYPSSTITSSTGPVIRVLFSQQKPPPSFEPRR